MKKIIYLLFVFIIIFVIYYVNLDRKVYVFFINDGITLRENKYISKEIDKYLVKNNKYEDVVLYQRIDDYRITDLYRDILDNIEFKSNKKNYKIDNALVKADIISLAIGTNDFLYSELKNDDMYEYTDQVFRDLNKLLKLIRKYSKERIIIYNYYNINNKDLYEYINKQLELLSIKYKLEIIYIHKKDTNVTISKKISKYLLR